MPACQTTGRGARRAHALAALTLPLALIGALATTPPPPSPASTAPPLTAPATPLVLPAPSGADPVGTTLLHLRDEDRPDPLDPAGGARELMVQVWYPAATADGERAMYAPPDEAAALQDSYPVPTGVFTSETNSVLDGPAIAEPHPVVLFHHGLCASRTDSTIVAEELASRGFVVVALGATGESLGVGFPDGRLVTTTDPAICAVGSGLFDPAQRELVTRLLDVRVADVETTIRALDAIAAGADPTVEADGLPAGLGGALDMTSLGIYGHSFGGATAAAAMHADERLLAGVDLDGFVAGPVATEGLDQPFLVIGSDYHDLDLDPSWVTFLPALRGWRAWFTVTGAGHNRFTDLGGSAHAWALDTTLRRGDPVEWDQVFGDIDDETSVRIVRRLVVAFFDRFLRGGAGAVLDDPTATFPEIVVQQI